MKKLLIILIILLFVGTLGFLVYKSIDKKVIFDTQTMTKGNIEKRTMATGTIVPRKEVDIKPQSISGIIEELYVEEGDVVKKGDKIAKITIIPDEVNLNGAISRVNLAKITHNNAKTNYDRDKALFEKDVIPRLELENTELAFLNAKEELSAAQNNLQLIKTGASSSSRSSNTIIRSTIDGMVLDVPVKEGNSVIASNNFNDGTTIASIADMGEIIFEGKVDETEVAKLFLDMPIKLTVGAVNDEEFDAILEHISPKGKEENGAIKFGIKAKVAIKEGQKIRAGYSANADIVLERRDSINMIKENYIIFENDSSFVEILVSETPQVFEKKPVKTGLSDGINIEIVEGISETDKIKAGISQPEKNKEANETEKNHE